MKGSLHLTADSITRKPICRCGKVMFDKKGARTKANWLMHRGRERLILVYPCPQSNTWHLTKDRRGRDRNRKVK